jgi:hypothetical protein
VSTGFDVDGACDEAGAAEVAEGFGFGFDAG